MSFSCFEEETILSVFVVAIWTVYVSVTQNVIVYAPEPSFLVWSGTSKPFESIFSGRTLDDDGHLERADRGDALVVVPVVRLLRLLRLLLLMAWRRVHGPRAVDDGQHPVPRVGDQRRFVKRLSGVGTVATVAAATSVVVVIVIETIIVLIQIVVVVIAATTLALVRPTFDGRHDRPLDAAATATTQRPGRQLQQTLPGVLVLVALQVVRATAPDRRRVCRE